MTIQESTDSKVPTFIWRQNPIREKQLVEHEIGINYVRTDIRFRAIVYEYTLDTYNTIILCFLLKFNVLE